MNIIEELDTFFLLNDMDDFSKIRYIYLYVCALFSYDSRYYFARPDIKQVIYDKELDITNIQEYEIVCYTYSKILVQILEYYGYRCEIRRDVGEDFKDLHAYVVVFLVDRIIKLDPTKKHDTARVKMNAGTYDFVPLSDDSTFEDDLKDADEYLKGLNNTRLSYYRDNNYISMYNYLSSLISHRDFDKEVPYDPELEFFNKMNAIFTIIGLKHEFTRYDDIDYYFSYLLRKSNVNVPDRCVYSSPFFRIDDPEMKEIINIIYINYNNKISFHIMEKAPGQEYYRVRESSPEEVLSLLDEYENLMNDEFFKKGARLALGKFY